MASTVNVSASVTTNDGTSDREVMRQVASALTIATAMASGKMEPVTLASGFNALSPPTGSQGVMIRLLTGALTLTLRGVSGDTGVVLQSGTLTTVPIILPLGTSPSIGINASGTGGTIEVLWF